MDEGNLDSFKKLLFENALESSPHKDKKRRWRAKKKDQHHRTQNASHQYSSEGCRKSSKTLGKCRSFHNRGRSGNTGYSPQHFWKTKISGKKPSNFVSDKYGVHVNASILKQIRILQYIVPIKFRKFVS
ncbi:unnamed protein product, partial [Rotaria magnacalcarata]